MKSRKILKVVLYTLTVLCTAAAVWIQIAVGGERLLTMDSHRGYWLARSYRWVTLAALALLIVSAVCIWVTSAAKRRLRSARAAAAVGAPLTRREQRLLQKKDGLSAAAQQGAPAPGQPVPAAQRPDRAPEKGRQTPPHAGPVKAAEEQPSAPASAGQPPVLTVPPAPAAERPAAPGPQQNGEAQAQAGLSAPPPAECLCPACEAHGKAGQRFCRQCGAPMTVKNE